MDIDDFAPARHTASGPAMLDQQERGAATVQPQRIAVDRVPGALEPLGGQVLAHRESVDVAGTALLEVPGGGMVNRVLPAPVGIGGGGENAGHPADDVIPGTRRQKGAVPAIVHAGK